MLLYYIPWFSFNVIGKFCKVPSLYVRLFPFYSTAYCCIFTYTARIMALGILPASSNPLWVHGVAWWYIPLCSLVQLSSFFLLYTLLYTPIWCNVLPLRIVYVFLYCAKLLSDLSLAYHVYV